MLPVMQVISNFHFLTHFQFFPSKKKIIHKNERENFAQQFSLVFPFIFIYSFSRAPSLVHSPLSIKSFHVILFDPEITQMKVRSGEIRGRMMMFKEKLRCV